MAQSLKGKPFEEVVEIDNGPLDKNDYVYEKFETWKFKAKTTNGSKIAYKASVKEPCGEGAKLDDEIKFEVPYKNLWYLLKLKRKGDLELHLDLGDRKIGGKDINLFGNLTTTTDMKKFGYKFGWNYFGSKCESNTRFETGNCCDQNGVILTQRVFVNKGQWFWGFLGSFFLQKQCVCTYNATVGVEKDNSKFYLEHKSGDCKSQKCCSKDKCCSLSLGELTATWQFKKDKNTFAAEVARPADGHFKVQAGLEREVCDKLKVKGKVNCCLDVSLTGKYKVNDTITAQASVKIPLGKPGGCGTKTTGCCPAKTCCFPFPVGLQFEVNI